MTEAAPPSGPVSAEHRRQALEWLVTLWSGEADAEAQAGLAAWRAAAAGHERAWLEVQQMDGRLRGLPAAGAAQALRAAAQRPLRRKVLRGLALVAAGGGALELARDSPAWQALAAGYRTATGERRDLLLADGTRIAMNTASALDVDYDAGQRRIDLRAGEIMIWTAAEPSPRYRPFLVHTAAGVARALGTQFVVRQDGAAARVAVYRGAVELTPAAHPQLARRLPAGQAARLTDSAVEAATALPPGTPAWLDGMLEAEQMRLADFLAELQRYRPGVIHCDAAVADLPVSGMYPLRDPQRILESLAHALPIRVTYLTRYWVSVQGR